MGTVLEVGQILLRPDIDEQRVRSRIVLRVVEWLERDLKKHLVAAAPRFRKPALQAVAGGREGQRYLLGQCGDRILRARLAEAKAADDNGKPCAARSGPGARISIERAMSIGAFDRQPAEFRLFEEFGNGKMRDARVLSDRLRARDDERAVIGAIERGDGGDDLSLIRQRTLQIGAGVARLAAAFRLAAFDDDRKRIGGLLAFSRLHRRWFGWLAKRVLLQGDKAGADNDQRRGGDRKPGTQ